MSFILQLFHAPQVRTVAKAVAFIDAGPPPSAQNRARFEAFRDDILRTYPDEAGGNPGDGIGAVWPEGWAHALTEEAVLVIAVATDRVNANFMRHVGHAAARAGLHVLDPQGGRLYRADATCIDLDGKEAPVGAPQPPEPVRPLPKNITAQALGQYLSAAFLARRPGLGLVASQWNNSFTDMDRTVGAVGQRITFYVSTRTEEALIGVTIELFCPAVTGVWQRLLGECMAAYLDRHVRRGRPAADLSLRTDDFVDPPGDLATELGARKYAHVHTFAEADAFVTRFDRWFAEQGAAALERLSSPAALAAIALTEHQRKWLYLRNELHIDDIFSRMVLAGAFDAARKGEWVAALRDHQKRTGPGFGKDPIEPDRKTVFEDMVTLLDSDAFAAEAARLRVAAGG